ncbi:MAG: response regulator [Pirellulales bacterium]|nr:response regulator [Pirellulales bacterium]
MKKVALGPAVPSPLGLQRRAMLASGLLAIALVAATALAYFVQCQLTAAARHTVAVDMPEAAMANRIALLAARCLMRQSEFQRAGASPEAREETVQSWLGDCRDLQRLLREGSVDDAHAGHRDRFARWLAVSQQHERGILSLAAESGRSGAPESLRSAVSDRCSGIDTVLSEAEQLAAEEAASCKAGGRRLEEIVDSQLHMVTLRSVIALLVLATATFWLSRSVFRRIAVLSAAVCRFTAGNHGTRIAGHSHDELGVLARQFNEMASTIQMNQEQLERARDAARAENRAKSEFLAALSEEISEPMKMVGDYAETMLGDLNDPDNRQATVTIRQSAEYLLEVVQSVLDLSEIELGQLRIAPEPCSLCQIVAEVCSVMRRRAEGKGLSLNVVYSGPVPESVHTDPVRLRQILVHMLGDAIRSLEIGSIRLAVRLVQHEHDPKLQFDVTDLGTVGSLEKPGSGVAGTAVPFFTKKDGTAGLGLTVGRRLTHLLGGTVEVGQNAGLRGTVTITVPVGPLGGVRMMEQPVESVVRREQEIVSGAPKVKLNCRILLAEDGPENQRLISFILKRAGAEVTVVDNGQEAIRSALPPQSGQAAGDPWEPYDVVLMDIDMPVMDGCEATQRLRRAGYTGLVIAVTGHARRYDRDKCLGVGFDDYVTKPIDRQTLLELLARHAVRLPGPAEATVAGAH